MVCRKQIKVFIMRNWNGFISEISDLEVKTYSDAPSFLDVCRNALEEDEINAGLIYGIICDLAETNDDYGREKVFYSAAFNKDGVSLVGLMTTPRNLLLYEHKNLDDDLLELFVDNLHLKYKNIPGVTCESKLAKLFSEKWARKTGCKYNVNVNMRIHKLTKVNKYNKPNGFFRIAEKNDLETVTNYIFEFNKDINELVSIDDAGDLAEKGIANNEVFLWDDNNIVSMAKKLRPTKNGMAVSYVYTPNEYRGKGYATAVVSELSRNILDSGKSFCMLYTDLSNPTSNSIYQKIGYVPLCDSTNILFEY